MQLTASTFTNCVAKFGAAVSVRGGDATITGCSFYACSMVYITKRTDDEIKTKDGQAVVSVEGNVRGQLTIDACRFERCLGRALLKIRSLYNAVVRNSLFLENNIERYDPCGNQTGSRRRRGGFVSLLCVPRTIHVAAAASTRPNPPRWLP